MNVGPGAGADGGSPAGLARPLAAYVIADVFAGPTCADARTPIGEVDLQTRYLGDTNLGIGLTDLRARTAPPREFAPDSFVPAATIELFLDGPPGTLPETVGQRGAGVVPGGNTVTFVGCSSDSCGPRRPARRRSA